MGIAPYKTFTFDGVSSSTYGVYLTGKGVFDAPERAVEMIEVPGRNGTFALDQGRFQNITVTYKVGMFDDSETDFATKVSNFRNWLCSKIGYVRLSDEYNPDEYRMAVYSGGFELDHDLLIAGEAEITFDCKPQRWLTSGETATAVANNGTLSNPTLFDAEPLLAVKGYGNIAFNGYSIDIENALLGNIIIIGAFSESGVVTKYYVPEMVNNGDTITLNNIVLKIQFSKHPKTSITIPTPTDSDSNFTTVASDASSGESSRILFTTSVSSLTFTVGTSSTVTNTVSASNGSIVVSFDCNVQYSATNHFFRFGFSNIVVNGSWGASNRTVSADDITADSTVSVLGNPTYIDCSIGECYMIKNSEVISLNTAIALGSDLPVLSPGTNTFTYDNTITELKVTPRWWKV